MKGTIDTRVIRSRALEGNPLGDPTERNVALYLPPGYDGGTRRFPVVYFLHGFSGSGAQWLNFSGFTPTVPERLDALIENGAPPPIGVFIDGWTRIGGSQWDNSEGIGRYRDYVIEVVRFVDQQLRTIPDHKSRAVVGKSSGGYGSLIMGRHHPDVFGHIGCHSGDSAFEYCYLHDFPKAAGVYAKAGGTEKWFHEFVERSRTSKAKGDDFAALNVMAMAAAYTPRVGSPLSPELPFDERTCRIKPEVWARWLAADPVRFVPNHLAAYNSLSSVFIDCGTRDEWNLSWGARMVVEELRKGGVEVVHEEFEDGHLGVNYRYDRSLGYLLPRLTREGT